MVDTKAYGEVTPIGRKIYYVLGVTSLIGLAYSIGALWPSNREDGTLIEIPNTKYLAVVLTSFFAVGLARTLFFDRPPPSHKVGLELEVLFPLCVYITVFVIAFIYNSEAGLVFAMSVITCGIAILQLSTPIEEFYVGKSLFIILSSLETAACFTATDNMAFAFFCALCALFLGVWGVMMIRDDTAELCSECHGRVTSKQ